MKKLDIYLFFGGRCEEALNFYKECIGGEIVSMKTFGDAPGDPDPAMQDKIMHAEFRADEVYFMASDGMGDEQMDPGNAFTLSINLDDAAEQEQIFKKLAEGGEVTMELQDTFWGARYGQLTDKFGIQWMLNCQKENS